MLGQLTGGYMTVGYRSRSGAFVVCAMLLVGASTAALGQGSSIERRSDPFPGSGHFPGFGKRLRITTQEYRRPSRLLGESTFTAVHVGRLTMWTQDSVSLTVKKGKEIVIPRSIVVRVDSAAGHKSRIVRAIIGVPLGISIGGLLGKPAGHGAVLGLAALGAPAGLIIGASTGGQRWKRMTLPPTSRVVGSDQ